MNSQSRSYHAVHKAATKLKSLVNSNPVMNEPPTDEFGALIEEDDITRKFSKTSYYSSKKTSRKFRSLLGSGESGEGEDNQYIFLGTKRSPCFYEIH